jgi:hypothetical protein
MLEFISVGPGLGGAIGAAGGGPARIAIAVAVGLLFGLPCPIIIHRVGRVAYKAGVHPLPMYVAAGLFPLAWGVLAGWATHHVIGLVGLAR